MDHLEKAGAADKKGFIVSVRVRPAIVIHRETRGGACERNDGIAEQHKRRNEDSRDDRRNRDHAPRALRHRLHTQSIADL